MAAYCLRRLLQAIAVLFIVTLLVSMIMHAMPGDPVTLFLGAHATTEQIEYYTEMFGLDQPVYVQYVKWIAGLFRGEMGRSITFQQEIKTIIGRRILVSLHIIIPSFIISVVIGVGFGIIAAVNRGKAVDTAVNVLANCGMSVPPFWFGILCVFIFSVRLGWLPVQGFTSLAENPILGIRRLVLPVLMLSIGPIASYTRQTRSAVLEVIKQDYMRTARSKGLKENAVLLRHALRNALIPIVTLMGVQLGSMIGRTVVVEQLFVVPGMGTLMYGAIVGKDYLLIQNGVLVIAASVMLCNFIVDIAYSYIDPRIRVE